MIGLLLIFLLGIALALGLIWLMVRNAPFLDEDVDGPDCETLTENEDNITIAAFSSEYENKGERNEPN